MPTVKDILAELDKPGRDPRPEFRTAAFKEGVQAIGDLTPGMQLEGVVTNVANFGAFVDIGVHQDGLVHVSQLADRFVKDPRDVVKAGDIVRVRVVEVDLPRKRIALDDAERGRRGDGGAPSGCEDAAGPGPTRARPAARARAGADAGALHIDGRGVREAARPGLTVCRVSCRPVDRADRLSNVLNRLKSPGFSPAGSWASPACRRSCPC